MSVTINGTNGLTFNDASTQNTAATGFGFKNRILNGNMTIDQRNAGASVTPATNDYTLDRWNSRNSVTSKYSVQQNAGSVTPPVGFKNYLGATSLAATTVGSTDFYLLRQAIEGYNVADLGWGTASAKTITLSFQVYSSLTGTFGGALQNSANDRSYPFSYSIPVANTWTSISVTIAGDTSGTWLSTNGVGIYTIFSLGTGSTYSTTAGSWAAGNYFSATGAQSVVGTNGATFYITGVQLEKGSTATSFDYRPYGTELALCQRYYWNITGGSTSYPAVASGVSDSSTRARTYLKFPTTMRDFATIGYTGSITVYDGANAAVTSIGANGGGKDSALVDFTVAAGLTSGRGAVVYVSNSASNFIYASAEL